MAWRFALMIDPAASDDPRTDFADTFTAVDPAAPALSVGELSTQRGDGIFESIGVVDGHAQEVQAHLDRLAHSARALRPARSRTSSSGARRSRSRPRALRAGRGRHQAHPQPRRRARPGADRVGHGRARRGLLASRGRDGIRVVTLDRGYDSGAPARAPWLLLGAKTLSYAVNMAAIREAKRRGADDAIFVSSDGFVLEAPTASLILRFGDRFVTPAPTGGILHGTTQLSLFAQLEEQGLDDRVRDDPDRALARADAAWLVSTRAPGRADHRRSTASRFPSTPSFTARLQRATC